MLGWTIGKLCLLCIPFQMSGGMLQRMMLALALMSQAPILIADEPTTDLDLVVQRHILNRLKKVIKERQLAMMIVTHDFGVVAQLADRVAIMHRGEIVEKHPSYPVVRATHNTRLASNYWRHT